MAKVRCGLPTAHTVACVANSNLWWDCRAAKCHVAFHHSETLSLSYPTFLSDKIYFFSRLSLFFSSVRFLWVNQGKDVCWKIKLKCRLILVGIVCLSVRLSQIPSLWSAWLRNIIAFSLIPGTQTHMCCSVAVSKPNSCFETMVVGSWSNAVIYIEKCSFCLLWYITRHCLEKPFSVASSHTFNVIDVTFKRSGKPWKKELSQFYRPKLIQETLARYDLLRKFNLI